MPITKKQWGRQMWNVLHVISFAYPRNPSESQKTAISQFISCLPSILPCQQCQTHFAELLSRQPLDAAALSSRDSFSRWMVDAHNSVNARLGKPRVSYTDAAARYSGLTGDISKDNDDGSSSSSSTWIVALALLSGVFAVALVTLAVLLAAAKNKPPKGSR